MYNDSMVRPHERTPVFKKDKLGRSYSSYPPTTYLTFDYSIFCVPQYKPTSVLILGYADGTVAGLIRLLYGDVPITGVDINPCEDRYGVTLIQADAKDYIKTCGKFDTVVVDLFSTEKCDEPSDFVTNEDFVKRLGEISNYLIVNGLHSDMSIYDKSYRRIGVNKPSGSAEQIYYYLTGGPIPFLHPWKN